ncbi:ATP-grasp domain-containing protein [uncultured Aquimarina sp.]|uniref:ATP-grasp domain-containing protein n=1 Tax=uncultured Aquimarina sp. TaxID=575652 RepID=UPI00262BFB59|nr:ATP-grasp domain-containing protein [uncultured Aquimarina sp.]
MQKIAVLYQAQLPPIKNGAQKPMKPNGYADSGADIVYELKKNGIDVITPSENPAIENDKDWVFPDTKKGIQNALDKGANIFWLNTVLFKNHSIENVFKLNIEFVGQLPNQVDIYDDKFHTNNFLKENQIPIPETQLISFQNLADYTLGIDFPLVIKPLRGRGSQGISLVKTKEELDNSLKILFSNNTYGKSIYLEQYLSGQEITITVMPAGIYTIQNQSQEMLKPWCLPAVKRFNHHHGIVPYNGIVAVMENSSILENDELNSDAVLQTYRACEKAAELLKIKAPIRIDCRADENGKYFLFDVNMKPNMTGPSRPQRKNQDSLTLLAARKIGWEYIDLLKNMLNQRWTGIP